MKALLNKYYSGHWTEIEGDQKHVDRSGDKMWTAGFSYNWRKMEAAAQDRA